MSWVLHTCKRIQSELSTVLYENEVLIHGQEEMDIQYSMLFQVFFGIFVSYSQFAVQSLTS